MTRFNVRGTNLPPPSDEWLRTRLDIFSRTALPSVRSQTVQPDRWLVLCDALSPGWFRRDLRTLLPDHGYEIVRVDGELSPGAAAEIVSGWLTGGSSHLITTRLDNDDLVARDFLALVQAEFREQNRQVINFTHGAQIANGRVYLRSDPSNAFASLIEGLDGKPRTVFVAGHHELAKHAAILQVKTDPRWIQMIHGANIANAVRGIRVAPERVLHRFDTDVPASPIGRLALAADRAQTTVRLAARVARKPSRMKWLWQVMRPRRG